MSRTLVVALGAAVLLVAGCGNDTKTSPSTASSTPASSSDAGDHPSPAPLTKSQYIVKADAICRATNKEVKKLDGAFDEASESNLKPAADALSGAYQAGRAGVDKLHALPAPSEDRSELEAYLASSDKLLAVAAGLRDAAKNNDASKAKSLIDDNSTLQADRTRLAATYGFADCGNGLP